MKEINLISLCDAKHALDLEGWENYLNRFMLKIKDNEMQDLIKFVRELYVCNNQMNNFNGYYVGYIIPQISKQFDLLRFGDDTILNIELKSQNTGEKILRQLKENKYYLQSIADNIYNFTYISDENKLLYLNGKEEIEEADFQFLVDIISGQHLKYVGNIDKLFDPTNYLISPFNSTDRFINDEYFLTDQQRNMKKRILSLEVSDCPTYITIQGAAGTGKTLLAYDIAKHYYNIGKKVYIIHCGKLNNGQEKLRNTYGWNIYSAKLLGYLINNNILKKSDLILIDECQRIYLKQLLNLVENIKSVSCKCIFSFDAMQCLSEYEILNDIPGYIENNLKPIKFELSKKIRTNKEIAGFIKNLFDLSKINSHMNYENINIEYFQHKRSARRYINTLKKDDWQLLTYTPSNFYNPYIEYQGVDINNAHEVIGQEFDKVIAVVDEHFYYNKKGILVTGGWSGDTHYSPRKMLFQILTRTRKKLTLVIINNKELLANCINILNNDRIDNKKAMNE
ncbi:DNA/RNA helicase domain-containing protein [Clostridium cadaveris]|uniref:DNA/RNA helicase domain-containing protein n=1 Tax=Clostridium cadaveris TaxID=1529 RepID=UPI0039A1761C